MGERRHTATTIEVEVEDLRAELGELLIELAEQMKTHFMATVSSEGLTMPQAMVMRLLDQPRSMRELADGMHYDASTITSLIDRLEERGLVRRSPHPTDRRVKHISLTPAGRAAQARNEERLFDRLPLLERLSADQQRALRDLLVVAVARDEI